MSVYILNKEETEKKISIESKEKLVVIYFSAPWCALCKALAPTIDSIHKILSCNEPTVSIYSFKFNADDFHDIADKYKIVTLPSIVFFKDGEIQGRLTGAVTQKAIITYIENLKAIK